MLSESSEVGVSLIGLEVENAIRKYERYLYSIHISDQFSIVDKYVDHAKVEVVVSGRKSDRTHP